MSQSYALFQQEMRYLRQSVEAFSRTYPEAAAELKLSAGRSNDPHVEQLLQSFAYMTGRLRADLYEQKDQIPNQLLHSLYPNLIRSLPCMAVLQANVEPDGANFVNGYRFEKGRQLIGNAQKVTQTGQKESLECRFTNCYPTDLWPLQVANTQVLPKNSVLGLEKILSEDTIFQSVVSIRVTNTGTEPIQNYPINRLRFYLGDRTQQSPLYQMLCDGLRGVVVKVGEKLTLLRPAPGQADSILEWQGFGDEQNVLPDDAGSQRAYRLLQEYFAFVEKFYFFDLLSMQEQQALQGSQEEFEILFLLDQSAKHIHLSKQSFLLNCFPVINLYEKHFKPIPLQHHQHEYRVLADEKHYMHAEVHSLTEVKSISAAGQTNLIKPWLGPNLDAQSEHYYVTRLVELMKPGERGCDTFVALYQADFSAAQPIDQTLSIKGLCNNRRLPEALREGQSLQLFGSGPMLNASIMGIPSQFKGAKLDGQNTVKLLSQLSLNLDSLSAGDSSLASLKQLLRLYCDPLSRSHQRQIDGLVELTTEAVVKRIGGDMWRGHCRGTLLSLLINEDYFSNSNPLLLGSVLSYFLGLYTSLNHFVQLKLISDQREGVWQQWQPRIGEQVIL
ncbi:type VI secretion system baseplate subunit TssF [Marinomonas aquiplantarum]|uniref:Type VI secretion system protein ImpG n=1 Tax=Marinomonas aquiplantarum TaxID=491951 RepID=A0A366CVN3_9GAMM|nr:type VI secretion system baseplate subunit TssF [Marinomonas aquiplantarum]RBO81897.1 type VI secretion system protein ImpG [Marinomonas aquiplantarum]